MPRWEGRPRTPAVRAAPGGHRDRECDQDDRDQNPGEQRRARHPERVHTAEREHRNHRNGLLPAGGRRVRRERDRHRGAARGLAHDEAPAGEIPPPRAEASPAVRIRAAGGGVGRGKLRGCGRVAERDEGGDGEPDEQSGARGLRRGGEGGEHASADHRAEPDEHGVTQAEAAGERGLGGHEHDDRPVG